MVSAWSRWADSVIFVIALRNFDAMLEGIGQGRAGPRTWEPRSRSLDLGFRGFPAAASMCVWEGEESPKITNDGPERTPWQREALANAWAHMELRAARTNKNTDVPVTAGVNKVDGTYPQG